MPLIFICCYKGFKSCFPSGRIHGTYLWNRYLVIGLIISVTILFVTPVRNLVTYPVLPASWRELSTLRILGLFFVKEKFVSLEAGSFVTCTGLEDKLTSIAWSSVVDQLDTLPAYDDGYFQNVGARLESYAQLSLADKLQDLKKRYPNFMPPISGQEQRELRLTFKVMSMALDLFNISYFLCEGSMLGAYRHHGFIPWDDDIDVCLNGSDWLRVKRILHCVPGFDVDTSNYMMYKFFWEGSRVQFREDRDALPSHPSLTSPKVRVPYIDMFFFTEDSHYIWAMSAFKKHRILYKKTTVFPLLWRPFEGSMAPVPRDYMRMCSGRQYDASVCVSRDFDHMNKRPLMPFFDYRSISCEPFEEIYPFVKRKYKQLNGRDSVLETLQLSEAKIKEYEFFA